VSDREKDEIEELLKRVKELAKKKIDLNVQDIEDDERVQQTRRQVEQLKRRV
jgi:C4-type Zn-finger protein